MRKLLAPLALAVALPSSGLGTPLGSYQYIPPGGSGEPTTSNAAIAMLLRTINGKAVPVCTGTLVGPAAVLTAAHCFCGDGQLTPKTSQGCSYSHSDWQVVFQHAGRLAVGSILVHPSYKWRVENGSTYITADLALVRLQTPVRGLPPMVLGSAPPTDGEAMSMAGFGYAGGGSLGHVVISPGLLVLVHATAMTCPEVLKGEGQVCRGASESVSRNCHGDSGGPGLNFEGRLVTVASAVSSACPQPGVAVDMDVTSRRVRDFIAPDAGPIASAPAVAVRAPGGSYAKLGPGRARSFDVGRLPPGYPETLIVVNGPDHTDLGKGSAPVHPVSVTVAGASCDPPSPGLIPPNVAECRFDTPPDGKLSFVVSGPKEGDPIQVTVTLRRERMQ